MGLARTGDWLLLIASAAGLILAIIAYSEPASGVSDTGGALLVIFSSAALVLAAAIFLAAPSMPRWVWRLLGVLAVLGALGSSFAGYMLMQWWFTAAMLVALLASLGQFAPRERAAT